MTSLSHSAKNHHAATAPFGVRGELGGSVKLKRDGSHFSAGQLLLTAGVGYHGYSRKGVHRSYRYQAYYRRWHGSGP